MLRRLTAGEFDSKIAAFKDTPEPMAASQAPPTTEDPVPETNDPDLDSLIFAYLTGADKK